MVVLASAAMSGCSAEGPDAEAAAQPEPAVESSAPEPTPGEAAGDAEICSAYGDVLTILENADIALDDGRMEPQEHRGWHALATRVLDRLPSTGDGPVHSAVAELKAVAVPAGRGQAPEGVRSLEWYAAEEALGAACDELGTPLAISMFTGG